MRARDIADQLGNWKFPYAAYGDAKSLAIIIMTMQKKRPNGHMGILITNVDKNGLWSVMAHASSRWGFCATDISDGKENYFFPRITKILQTRW